MLELLLTGLANLVTLCKCRLKFWECLMSRKQTVNVGGKTFFQYTNGDWRTNNATFAVLKVKSKWIVYKRIDDSPIDYRGYHLSKDRFKRIATKATLAEAVEYCDNYSA